MNESIGDAYEKVTQTDVYATSFLSGLVSFLGVPGHMQRLQPSSALGLRLNTMNNIPRGESSPEKNSVDYSLFI